MLTQTAHQEPLVVATIFPQIEQICDATLRGQVEAVWQELWRASAWRSFDHLPTSGEISYPAKPHSQCVLTMALAVADAFEAHHGMKVDRDLLIAEAILQDASKVVEYRPDASGKAVHTEIGTTFQHGFWCAHVALKHGLPMSVCHIMVTHSPGAAKFPDTLEGKILYYVDQLDVIAIHKDRWKKNLMVQVQR